MRRNCTAAEASIFCASFDTRNKVFIPRLCLWFPLSNVHSCFRHSTAGGVGQLEDRTRHMLSLIEIRVQTADSQRSVGGAEEVSSVCVCDGLNCRHRVSAP